MDTEETKRVFKGVAKQMQPDGYWVLDATIPGKGVYSVSDDCCWLYGLERKRVRLTVEVLEDL